jgi:hypothetical protein
VKALERSFHRFSHWLSLQGMHWQEREDDDVPGLQPHVPADGQKLITRKGERRRKPDFRLHSLNKEKET